MKILALVVLAVVALAVPALAVDQNTVTWTDNSSNETQFDVWRTTAATVTACQSATGWAVIGTTGANVTK